MAPHHWRLTALSAAAGCFLIALLNNTKYPDTWTSRRLTKERGGGQSPAFYTLHARADCLVCCQGPPAFLVEPLSSRCRSDSAPPAPHCSDCRFLHIIHGPRASSGEVAHGTAQRLLSLSEMSRLRKKEESMLTLWSVALALCSHRDRLPQTHAPRPFTSIYLLSAPGACARATSGKMTVAATPRGIISSDFGGSSTPYTVFSKFEGRHPSVCAPLVGGITCLPNGAKGASKQHDCSYRCIFW